MNNSVIERVENNFINIYKKFDILDGKLIDYHIKIHKINQMINIIISDEYTKVYESFYLTKNFDLTRDRFFMYIMKLLIFH